MLSPSSASFVYFSAYFTLKMEAIYFFETSVDFQLTTLRYIPGGSTLQNERCETAESDYGRLSECIAPAKYAMWKSVIKS
jgi:hypothetical protein